MSKFAYLIDDLVQAL